MTQFAVRLELPGVLRATFDRPPVNLVNDETVAEVAALARGPHHCPSAGTGCGIPGAGDARRRPGRFEVEGADLAAGLLAEHGVPDGDIGRVWEAIALHSSVGLADRMGLLTYLTHKGVFTDGGRFAELPPALQAPVRAAYPRPAGDRSLPDAIVEHARKSPEAAPPFSIAAELLRRAGG